MELQCLIDAYDFGEKIPSFQYLWQLGSIFSSHHNSKNAARCTWRNPLWQEWCMGTSFPQCVCNDPVRPIENPDQRLECPANELFSTEHFPMPCCLKWPLLCWSAKTTLCCSVSALGTFGSCACRNHSEDQLDPRELIQDLIPPHPACP